MNKACVYNVYRGNCFQDCHHAMPCLEMMQAQDAAEGTQDVEVLGYRLFSLLSNGDSSFTEARCLQGHAIASSFLLKHW